MSFVVYTRSNARQNFSEVLAKVLYSGKPVGIGKSVDRVEALVVKRPEDWDATKEWVLVSKESLEDRARDVLYSLYRLMMSRREKMLD